MAKKLNSMPDYKANLPRNPHDLSQSISYTTVPGQISPVYFDMLHTGDEIFFRGAQFTRLNPLEKPPLGQIDVHIDYFFVPLTVMYLPSSSLFYQTDDLVSSLIDKDELIKDKFPTVNMNGFVNNIFAITGEGDERSGKWSDQPIFDQSGDIGYEEPFDCAGKSIFRMFDFLDMNPQCIYERMHSGSISDYPRITPWFALAYQAIYQLFYRNDDREFKNYHYNIDYSYSDGQIDAGNTANSKSIFQINYVSRPKDYFNSVKANPIGSAVSSLSGTTLNLLYSQVNDWLSNASVYSASNDGSDTEYGNSASRQSASASDTGSIGSAQIRQLFMVDKLLRVVGRAEKNYESQFLAHFGIKIPHDVMHNITHIGHDMVSMNAESVISKADTFNTTTGQGSALGEVGGQASCTLKHDGEDFHFKAPFHGVFMAVSYIVPRRRYITGLNKLHSLNSPSDFYQPEFDKKGMQPLFNYEFNPDFVGGSAFIGWQFGYEQFKRTYDRITTAFMPTLNSAISVNTLSPWVVANRPYCFLDNACQVVDYSSTKMAISLLCAPTDLNSNMIVPYNTNFVLAFIDAEYFSPWLLYQTDPFICDFNMHLKKVNSMSEYSEPEL